MRKIFAAVFIVRNAYISGPVSSDLEKVMDQTDDKAELSMIQQYVHEDKTQAQMPDPYGEDQEMQQTSFAMLNAFQGEEVDNLTGFKKEVAYYRTKDYLED